MSDNFPRSRSSWLPTPVSLHILRRLLALVCLFTILPGLHLATSAAARDRPTTMAIREATTGTLLFRTADPGRFVPAPTLNTDVHITIAGIIARATIKQEFVNPSREQDDWMEGVYVFPLPETAAVDHLRMRIGDRIIEGHIKERAEAKQMYEQAKRKGTRTGLVEQERPNMFTTSVANIGPGDHITVEIEYQETIRYDQNRFMLRFPTVVGPRFIPGVPDLVWHGQSNTGGQGWSFDTDRVPDASRITPPVQHPREGPVNPIRLTLDLMAGFAVGKLESASHAILTIKGEEDRYHVTLRDESVPADRDFEFSWEPADRNHPVAASYAERTEDSGYALLLLVPPAAAFIDNANVPREVVYVIDTSGSMAGTSIVQAKAALQAALGRLRTQDRFNVIQFNSVTHRLFAQAQPVTTRTMQQAVRYVDGLTARGGTEMLPALRLALDGVEHHDRLRQVVFLTDGQIGNEEELFQTIHRRLCDSRLFTVGIGAAPNSHFMRKAAEVGRGSFTYIGNAEEVKSKMEGLFQKLERPILTHLQVDGLEHSQAAQLFPSPLPDLYAGEPLSIVLKASPLPDHLIVTGMIGRTPWRTELSLIDAAARSGISVHWARQKIAALMDGRIVDRDAESLRHAIVDVALAHHLVSSYTSLVAVDVTSARPQQDSLRSHSIKTNLPDGQQYEAIFGLPRTATPGPVHLLIGIGCLASTWLLWIMSRRRFA
jgi:Ca-activated chloride channel family protein